MPDRECFIAGSRSFPNLFTIVDIVDGISPPPNLVCIDGSVKSLVVFISVVKVSKPKRIHRSFESHVLMVTIDEENETKHLVEVSL